MAEDGVNKPKEQPEKEQALAEFRTSVEAAIDKKDPKAAIAAIVDLATANNGVPDDAAKVLQGLDAAKKNTLATFLSAKGVETLANDTREHLRAFAQKMNLGTMPEFGLKTTADTVMNFINKKVEDMGIGKKFEEQAKKFGFQSGDATKWMKDFFTGMAAGVMESIAFSLKSFNMNTDGMLKTSADLRIRQLGLKGKIDSVEPSEAKTFFEAYKKRAEQVMDKKNFRPPQNLKDAEEILKTATVQPTVAAEAQKPRTKIQVQEGENSKKIKTGFKGTPDLLFSKKDNIVTLQSGDKKITIDKKISAVEVLEATDQDDAVILFTLLEDKSQVKVLASALKTSEKNVEAENTQSYQKSPLGFTIA